MHETIVTASCISRFCRQSFELDSGDRFEIFTSLLRERGEIEKICSLIERNSADIGLIVGVLAVITVITVTFAIER